MSMQRQLRGSLALVALALAGCQSATDPQVAAGSRPSLAARGPKAVQVVGSGHVTTAGEWRNFSISAQRSPDGTVTGQMQVNNREQDRMSHSEVVCVGVFGNTAFLGIRVLTSNDPGLVGTYAILTVVDNGEGANATPDQISLFTYPYTLSTLTTWCAGGYGVPFQSSFLTMHPVEAGNIQIR